MKVRILSVAFVAIMTHGVAHAASYDLGEVRIGASENDVKIEFGVNEKLGRAWVIVTEDDHQRTDESPLEPHRILVDGLRYDRPTRSIMFRNVVCAVRGKSVFGIYRETKRCRFERPKVLSKMYDDGFEQYWLPYVNVTLIAD